MALTATTIFDLTGQTQSIIFNSSGSQVDQISFASNQITYTANSTFTLNYSDCALYYQYLNTFNVLLFKNFPSINASVNGGFPLCQFDISLTDVGVQKITFTQNSGGTNVYTINYLPLSASGGFLGRASSVTVSLQEYFMGVYMMQQYFNQIETT